MFEREKFKRLVHYVIAKAGHKDGFGATKLYKVLWFAEARALMLHGRPIAGATYIREKHGPVPRLGMIIRSELVAERKIRQQKMPGDYGEWQFTSLAPPVLDGITPRERTEVDYWIKHIDADHTATSISEESHDYGWEIARNGEVIPLHACMANRAREPNGEELSWARQRAAELGLI